MVNKASPITVTALLLGALALVGQLVPNTARAAERVALVIGNASYKEAPLRNPVNDARDMATTLEGLGFEVIRVENASKEEMERAIGRFTGRLDEESSGLFYYAGHGVQVRGRNYLVPVDAKINSERDARIESVPINLVLDELEYAGNRLNVVILDACRNNPFERRMRGASRGLAAVDAARGTLIAYATSPGSLAQDGDGRNGLYTEELLRALRLPGLEVEDVFKEVRIKVSERTDYQQIPWESSSLTGKLVLNQRLSTVPQTSSAETRNESLFWESIESSGTVEAYRLYLQQFPNGIFATLANFRIDELERIEISGQGGQPTTEERATDKQTTTSRESSPYRFALYPHAGKYWRTEEPCVDEAAITREIQDRFFANAAIDLQYDYDINFDRDITGGLQDLAWRRDGVRKRPNFEKIVEHTQHLNVDAVLLYWYEAAGTYCSRISLEIFLYDLKLQKAYTEEGTSTNIQTLSDNLIERYLRGRSQEQQSQLQQGTKCQYVGGIRRCN